MPHPKMVQMATRLVDLILTHKEGWPEVTLGIHEEQTLFDAVKTAGFRPRGLKREKLMGRCGSSDAGRFSDGKYVINDTCPFKVIDRADNEDHFGTAWLNYLVQYALLRLHTVGRDNLIQDLANGIEQSTPHEPIELTIPDGLLLAQTPTNSHGCLAGYFTRRTKEEDVLSIGGSCIGIHEICNGYVNIKQNSRTHHALLCPNCGLRIPIPIWVKTYGDLRKALRD